MGQITKVLICTNEMKNIFMKVEVVIMDAKAEITGEKVLKVLGAACMATGVVALSAVVASGGANLLKMQCRGY